MAGAHPEQVVQHRVGNLAHEMNAAQIELTLQLGEQHLLPAATLGRRRPIADALAPHQDHVGPRPQLLQQRQGAQKGVKSPIGLQIAGHKTHHLVAGLEAEPSLLQVHVGTQAGCNRGGVDAFVDHRHPIPEGRRGGGGLPMGRSQGPVEIMEGQQLGGPPQPQPGLGAKGDGELGIETGVGPLELVDELQLMEHGNIGPVVLDPQQFPPTWMAQDQIRPDDLVGTFAQEPEHGLGPDHLDLEILGPGMHRRHGADGRQPVTEARHTRHPRGVGSADRLNLVAAGDECTHEVPILAWEILMDDQNTHK